jgi:hypothetical protein
VPEAKPHSEVRDFVGTLEPLFLHLTGESSAQLEWL